MRLHDSFFKSTKTSHKVFLLYFPLVKFFWAENSNAALFISTLVGYRLLVKFLNFTFENILFIKKLTEAHNLEHLYLKKKIFWMCEKHLTTRMKVYKLRPNCKFWIWPLYTLKWYIKTGWLKKRSFLILAAKKVVYFVF